jgi:hypothetical protein
MWYGFIWWATIVRGLLWFADIVRSWLLFPSYGRIAGLGRSVCLGGESVSLRF